jgi:hypothetical protein
LTTANPENTLCALERDGILVGCVTEFIAATLLGAAQRGPRLRAAF